MAYKKTGKPVGRPKTKEYTTLLARVPADLADLVKRYASQHPGMSVAELIREGLEWRVGDGDPRGMGMYLAQPIGISEQVYNSNTGIGQGAQEHEALQEVRALLARQYEQIQALAQALERQRVLDNDSKYSSNTENAPDVIQDGMVPRVKVDKEEVIGRIQQMRDKGLDSTQITKALQAEGVPTLSGEAQLQAVVEMLEQSKQESIAEQTLAGGDTRGSIPPYDSVRHHLGKLCPSKHEWGTTGQSLRNADNQCLQCKAQAKREKREAKRQAQLVSG